MDAHLHQDFRQAACAAATAQEAWDLTCAYLARFGFEGAFLAEQRGADIHVRSNIDAEWARYAEEQGLIDADPFFAHCFRSYEMLRTGRDHLHLYPFLTEDEVAFIEAASEGGLRAGLSIPARLRRDGGLSGWHILSSHGAEAVAGVWREEAEDLRLSLLAVHHRLVGELRPSGCTLSIRERDCLQMCGEGARNTEISDRLGISESTVEFHLRNARKKLGARTRDHAVALAIRAGMFP